MMGWKKWNRDDWRTAICIAVFAALLGGLFWLGL